MSEKKHEISLVRKGYEYKILKLIKLALHSTDLIWFKWTNNDCFGRIIQGIGFRFLPRKSAIDIVIVLGFNPGSKITLQRDLTPLDIILNVRK